MKVSGGHTEFKVLFIGCTILGSFCFGYTILHCVGPSGIGYTTCLIIFFVLKVRVTAYYILAFCDYQLEHQCHGSSRHISYSPVCKALAYINDHVIHTRLGL